MFRLPICIALAFSLLAPACAPTPDPSASDERETPSAATPTAGRIALYRLTEKLVHGRLPQNDLTCAVGSEIRPALGCLTQFPLYSGAAPTLQAGVRQLTGPVDEFLEDQQFIIERSAKGAGLLDWQRLEPELGTHGMTSFTTTIEAENPELVELWARPLPPAYRHFRTQPLAIPSGAQLQVGVGLVPLAVAVGASGVSMQLVARTKDKEKILLDTRVLPADTRWQDHAIDLTEFAGKNVAFHFVSNLLPQAAEEAFTAPLWGAPTVTAPGPADGPPNVILISLDTLRADYVGATKEGRQLTPNLDKFRARGAVFTNAMTTYPSTTGSHMSLFTGVYPATHETIHARKKLPPEIPTMAQALAPLGFATAAVTENAMLNATSGFLRGFDSYKEQKGDDVWSTDGAIRQTFDDGLAWLDTHGEERFFLFLHTYQVHFPYTPPKRHNHFRRALNRQLPEDPFERQKVWAERGYAGEVLYTDEEVGRLLRILDERGLLENTILIITADHGEEFGEHGEIGHAQTLYAEVLNIPLSIQFPGRIPAGSRIEAPVSLVDILPTIFDLAGLPPLHAEGQSLVPLLDGGQLAEQRAVYAQNYGKHGQQWAARTGTRKFIFQGNQKIPFEVFDLEADAGETTALDGTHLAAEGTRWITPYREIVIAAMTRRMEKEAAETAPHERRLDEGVVNKLRALGYMD
ncbi:MAG: sulfatase [Deltaproteobacteria bacterium]